MVLITKSKYMLGLQCPKLLWISVNAKDEIPTIDKGTEHKFKQGALVGVLAKERYPEGIQIPTSDFIGNINKTQELLGDRVVLFEAGFKSELQKGEIFSRVDILVPADNDYWDIVEVKSSTSVKDENIDDVSFQKFCLESTGLRIRNCFLLHINNQYIKDGEIDVRELFTQSDITEFIDERMAGIEDRINQMLEVISVREKIEQPIGSFCNKPYECSLKSKCWSFLPLGNVFDLYYGGRKSFELLEQGVQRLADIPDGVKLNAKQIIQKECAISGEAYINNEKISNFLNSLNYPLYFMDFETIRSAIPIFDRTKPYQQIPFQVSLHIQEHTNAELQHVEYLPNHPNDPRIELLECLKSSIGGKGDIIVFNASFEKGRLQECADAFPDYKDWIENKIIPRLKDLLIPFRNFEYYHPNQKGSASLKNVLPIFSDATHSELAISDGDTAGIEFSRIMYENNRVTVDEKNEVIQALLAYCHLDTYAEIIIIKKLRELVSN